MAMAQQSQPSTYTQGYSNCTIATHLTRTANADAAFVLPYVKKTDRLLDLGCGPGTITIGLAKYASEGSTIGLDISKDVLQKAKALATEANMPTDGPGSLVFEEANVLEGLEYQDDTFDIIFCSQVIGHIPPPDLPVKALSELRRILKPGGILATRDGLVPHFFPRSLELDRLWSQNQLRGFYQGNPPADPTNTIMPALFRRAGFDADGGKVKVGVSANVQHTAEQRKWLAWRGKGQLKEGDSFRQSWLDAGISEAEIEQTIRAIETWEKTEDAFFTQMQCEMLGWK